MQEDKPEIRTTLRDGTEVLIRQIRPDDKKYIELGMSELSLESRYFRFHSAKATLSPEELEGFTEIDHTNHDAWGALDISREKPHPIGIARYVRLPGDDNAADVAVTVIDEYQGKGVGSLLLGVIASRAAENGIERFRSTEVHGNKRLFDLISGLQTTQHYLGGSEVEVEFPIFEDASAYPDCLAGNLMRYGSHLYHKCSQ